MANLLVEKRDIDFVLYEQFNIADLIKNARFSHCSKEDFDMIIEHALKFAENVLAPINREGDELGAVWENGEVRLPESARKALKEFGEAGWVSMTDDFESGGQQLPMSVYAAAYEMFFAANAGLALYPCLTHGAGKMVDLFGTDEQKNKYLEKLFTFDWCGTMCLTETGAGSDLAHVTTKAVKADDKRYKITGQKIFISSGENDAKENIIHPVLARIEGDPRGIKGISIFLVPKYRLKEDGTPGEFNDVHCTGIEHKMGLHVSSSAQLSFGDNNECFGELLGEPRQGILIMFHMMNEERYVVGLQALGLSSAAYLNALNYARQRLQGTDISRKGASMELVPIIKHPDIRRSLLFMKSYVEGLRALNYFNALCMDKSKSETDENEKKIYSGLVEFFTPISKAYTTDWVWDITEQAIQIYGGYGYCQDYPVEQFARDSKILSLYEGTNGIQAIDLLSRKLGLQNGKVFKHILNEIDKTVNEAMKDESLKRYARIVIDAKSSLIKAADHLTGLINAGKVHNAFLSATPFLEVVGDTLLGWMHLWQLMIVNKKLNIIFTEKNAKSKEDKIKIKNENKEAAFYSGKEHSARFFITKVLPLQKSKVETILNEDTDALDIEGVSFGEEMNN
ncbi:MAG: acyl-CoA dehydrogenase [Spirochaetota bacterium]